ncbi:hypothetical protein [Saccharothrix sp. Mg75]|uniref:hypothetical protein n=1 Tax=Saccharothrix sp. Mg75 TaxID=3445357 RepID=UPI003EECFC1D
MWQNRRLGGHAPARDPGGAHSPNTLFAASMTQGGVVLRFPPAELYYLLLPTRRVRIHSRRQVKVKGLWYDGPVLDDHREGRSGRGGVHRGTWVVRRYPRDRRVVWFQDSDEHAWHEPWWTDLPPKDEVPRFGDARVVELLARARDTGLTPRGDAELLPVLLELLGRDHPADGWHGRGTGRPRSDATRRDQACEQARATAAHADPDPPPCRAATVAAA